MFNIEKIRKDFPILSQKVNGKPNAFLDSAASSQKPKCVIDKISHIFQNQYANVHRGSYHLSESITNEYEQARKTVQNFISAASEKEIIFTRNATESINLVAATWGKKFLKKGDEVLISVAEHHANLIPWQMLRDEIGITLKFFNLNDDGSFSGEEFEKALSSKTKLVSITAMSNVLGTIFPVKDIIKKAHQVGAKVLIDACQYIVHHKINVTELDCDFLVFSGHKLYGPTGIGVLYGKYNILDSIPPYQTGGDMVDKVSFEKTTFAAPPARFEAGTPAIVEAIGLSEAIRYLEEVGMENISTYEKELTAHTTQKLSEIKDLKIIGTAKDKGGIFSFVVENIHPQDLAFILDKEGVSIRTGHHCAEPLVNLYGHTSLARASLGMYTTKADIDQLVAAINKAKTFF